MKIWNVFGMRLSGAFDKSFVAASWKGTNYLRAYVVPRGPPTTIQLEHRRRFVEATEAWKRLTPEERKAYDRAARRMSGYNLFIKRFLMKKQRADCHWPERVEEELPPDDGKQPEEL